MVSSPNLFMPGFRRWSRTAVALGTAVVFTILPTADSVAVTESKSDLFAAGRSIELLGDVYREVTENYVDKVDVSQLMFSGIDGMLDKLDPFTAFLDESETEELDELTTGKYAGIGITIGLISDDLYIMSVIDGNAASRAGLRVGDRIVSVNGVKARKRALDEVRSQIKGLAGSTVRLGIERSGVREVREYTLTRSEVRVSTISYTGLFGSIGYVGMDSFGERTSEELRASLQSLQQQASLRNSSLSGIVLDLRGNPGGLLSTAVDVAGAFLAKGSTVVSTRGRSGNESQIFVTKSAPLVPTLPLAVLIDGDSASASEIVAGAIQELDRGVILGGGSFGKGLVQSVIPLPYDHVLKLTTSKYYTPSGRLIQKPIKRAEGSRKVLIGASTVDSTKVFFTLHRRKVYGGGGIHPDLVVRAPEASGYEHALEQKGMFFRYANRYHANHSRQGEADLNGGYLFGDFRRFVAGERFAYRSRPQLMLDSLKTMIRKEYGKDADKLSTGLDQLDQALASKVTGAIAADSARIASSVRLEVIRHYDEKAARRAAIEADPVAQKAFSLLADPNSYRALLRP